MRNTVQSLVLVAAVTVLSACATSSPDVISRQDAQVAAQVQDGTVISIRPVTVDGSQSGMGAAAGGIVGAAVGTGGSTIQREKIGLGVLGNETLMAGDSVIIVTSGGKVRVSRAPR